MEIRGLHGVARNLTESIFATDMWFKSEENTEESSKPPSFGLGSKLDQDERNYLYHDAMCEITGYAREKNWWESCLAKSHHAEMRAEIKKAAWA